MGHELVEFEDFWSEVSFELRVCGEYDQREVVVFCEIEQRLDGLEIGGMSSSNFFFDSLSSHSEGKTCINPRVSMGNQAWSEK